MTYINNFLISILDFFYNMTGNYGVALILFTVLVKLVLYPLTHQQFKALKEQQKIQPEQNKLREKYKDDPQKLNEELVELYRRHGVNPLGGCLPLIIQFPILAILYSAINAYSGKFANASFLWIKSLAAPDLPLLIIYGISMVASSLVSSPLSDDPAQRKSQLFMGIGLPVVFTVLFRSFPSAFILYWFVFNILTTIQQLYVMKVLK
ncbi:MAG TPA: YidC/Oxa1 family membrane protein insertase [bacterium]|nr:membrane protein insertase YidC [Dictyoglomota bacterium]HOP55240.1 YidC/Oxa1 family membrane protein insertase [bacterium]